MTFIITRLFFPKNAKGSYSTSANFDEKCAEDDLGIPKNQQA